MIDVAEAFGIAEKIASNIMVIGVGGAGCNAVEGMYRLGIHNVMFMVCNTDTLALNKKPIPMKIPLGTHLTNGLGAGADPSVGREAALETETEIRRVLEESGTKMAFITAGMGGGTGTGAAPVIARIAREMGILTVGIVTIPQKTEGAKRMKVAMDGLREIVKFLDSVLIIDNQAVVSYYGELKSTEAFAKANDILAEAAKGIAEIITVELTVNVDFADVRTTMRDSGITLMGSSVVKIGADTPDLVEQVMTQVLHSPLLMKNDIAGAKNLLVNISWGGEEPSGKDIDKILNYVQEASGDNYEANLIYGMGKDDSLAEDELKVVLVATAFDNKKDVFGLYDIAVEESGDALKKERPLKLQNPYDTKVRIFKENIDYLKNLPFDQVEDKPAFRRYKIDLHRSQNSVNKKVVKLEEE